MKCVIFVGDGMAGEPCPDLGGKTSLQAASHPHMDEIASKGVFGKTITVPKGFSPGSDVANLSILGVSSKENGVSRSAMEAAGVGIALVEGETVFRCNMIAVSGPQKLSDCIITDYGIEEIATKEAGQLLCAVREKLSDYDLNLYTGVGYRHYMVLKNTAEGFCGAQTPPHDITGVKIGGSLPRGENAGLLLKVMEASREAFKGHPVNQSRVANGEKPIDMLWPWAEGKSGKLPAFKQMYGFSSGCMISGVPLLQGMARLMGLKVIKVQGATGGMVTDYAAKGEAAVRALKEGVDFVCIHVEAPDECGHHGLAAKKINAIEQIDEKILGPVLSYLQNGTESWAALVMPDHPTPLTKRCHTADAVPFAFFQSDFQKEAASVRFCEADAEKSGLFVPCGHTLLKGLLEGAYR